MSERAAGLPIANRGDVAVRVARAADAIDLPCVTVFAADDVTAREVGGVDTNAELLAAILADEEVRAGRRDGRRAARVPVPEAPPSGRRRTMVDVW